MLRRDLLKLCAAAPLASAWWPAFAAPTAATPPAPRYLVLVEFNGGNDGLNTVIPYADQRYHDARPNIAIGRDQVLHLDEHVGLHPALAPLMPLWSAKQLAVVQAVGYPQPNRSHFRSIEIWDTGSNANEFLDAGWLARALPHSNVTQGFTADTVVIGRNTRPATGNGMRTLVIDGDIENFAMKGSKLQSIQQTTQNPALAHILEIQDGVNAAAHALLAEAQQAPAPQADFPTTPIGKSLQQAARLILMNHSTPVIKVALSSFDTHAQQRKQQDKLLGEFADGVVAFQTALAKAGAWDRVMMFTYSEFGRRVNENASGGTDHGTAAPVFALGGSVKGALYGQPPSLADLDEGDLRFQQDFRGIYNTVLKNWWGLPQTPFDLKEHPPLAFV